MKGGKRSAESSEHGKEIRLYVLLGNWPGAWNDRQTSQVHFLIPRPCPHFSRSRWACCSIGLQTFLSLSLASLSRAEWLRKQHKHALTPKDSLDCHSTSAGTTLLYESSHGTWDQKDASAHILNISFFCQNNNKRILFHCGSSRIYLCLPYQNMNTYIILKLQGDAPAHDLKVKGIETPFVGGVLIGSHFYFLYVYSVETDSYNSLLRHWTHHGALEHCTTASAADWGHSMIVLSSKERYFQLVFSIAKASGYILNQGLICSCNTLDTIEALVPCAQM